MDPVEPVETDELLWRRATAGDAAGMGLLFQRHANTVYNHCFRQIGNWSTAEDLTSVAFLEAWRQRRRLRLSPTGSVLPWLLGIANNVVRNHTRSLRRYERALARLPPQESEADLADAASRRMDAELEMATILPAYRRLRREEQEVLALCAWTGLSYEDASIALAIPVGTVRSRLNRARQHLRDLLGRPTTLEKEMR
ncbi:RNA polymerase sigma factor [Actinosynnema sp. CA-299493]